MTANDLTLGDLFAQRGPFHVPKYQRSYAWEQEEIRDYVRDLEQVFRARIASKLTKHFFGGIVCLQHIAQNAMGRKYEVIDGQQRLATFGIFFAALRHANTKLAAECMLSGDHDSAKLAESRANRILAQYLQFDDEVDGRPVQQPRIVLSKADKDFYDALLSRTELTPGRQSHRLLVSASWYIDEFVNALIAEVSGNGSKLAVIDTLAKAATEDCHVVHLVSEIKKEAYRLFEVLNDRGRNLSEGDLLRSNTLERLEESNTLQEQAEKIWDSILSAKASQVDRFLRAYYASKTGRRAGARTLFDDFVTSFFPTALSPSDVLGILKDRQETFTLFGCISEGEWPYEQSAVSAWDRNRLKLSIGVLKNELSMPLLLSACKLPEKSFAAVVQAVEFAVFRHIHCCRQHPSKLDSVFLDEARTIRADPNSFKIAALRKALKNVQDAYSGDSKFNEGIRSELVYREKAGNTVIKYFLTTVEQFESWYRAGGTGAAVCKDKTIVYDP